MTERLERQAEALRQIVSELVKEYPFRGWQEICCHSISASPDDALAALDESKKLTMGELAEPMYRIIARCD
ncbi:hypothetical protein HRbin10_00888 [bacterium HR10]|nr:hypothetical protein HRbin10_00888 [bacterium HR10]